MMFVWKTTCRRLQSSGALARFAEGAATEQERGEIEKHLAECPACQTTAADALSVASLLNTTIPSTPPRGSAASGKMWAALEAQIARTPQDPALVHCGPASGPVPLPRLQRFGHWLATPGALPFGSVAAAAVVAMVGIVTYQRMGFSPTVKQTASVRSARAIGDTEFTILAPSASPVPSAPGAAAKSAPRLRARLAPVAVAAAPESNDLEIAPLARKPLQDRVLAPAAPARRSLSLSAPSPLAPRTPALQIAKATATEFSAASALAPAPAPAAPSPTPQPLPGTEAASSRDARTSMASVDADTAAPGSVLRKDAPPVMRAKSRLATAPAAVASASQGADAVLLTPENSDSALELQNSPAVRSLLDRALRQRRQRTLFSYATR